MSNKVELIPTGLDDIISKSDTLSSWGYTYNLEEEDKNKECLDTVEKIRNFIHNLTKK